ncbi:MAG: competence protein ComEA, partial [Clostridia bacterium]|nr:competence protein ComEA [Clostridia bacterium]
MLFGAIVAVILLVFYYINSTKDLYIDNEFSEEENVTNEVDSVDKNKIVLHITGAVTNEGIVEVNENARINDVIEAAGGLREDADISEVNLAYPVEDGQKIYIP